MGRIGTTRPSSPLNPSSVAVRLAYEPAVRHKISAGRKEHDAPDGGTASKADYVAAVSSVRQSPLAPKSLTLMLSTSPLVARAHASAAEFAVWPHILQ